MSNCEKEEEAFGDDDCFDDYAGQGEEDYNAYNSDLLEARTNQRSGFKELESAKEYCERQYYGITHVPTFPVNPFWVDFANHITDPNKKGKPFLTANFMYATSCHTELIAVISLLDLPFTSPSHTQSGFEQRGLEIEVGTDVVVFTKDISEGKADLRPEILIAQRFFDPKDRFTYSEEDPGVQLEKEVEQYVINKIYGCKVTVTNCSISSQEVQVLVEIPEGALPVSQLDYTKSHNVLLPSTGNVILESYFYFPSAGKFKVYPSNVSKNGRVLALAREQSFEVATERKYTNLESFSAVLAQGSEADILNFVATKNIWDTSVFNFSNVWWLLKKEDFFKKLIKILRERNAYDHTTWSYGFYHSDAETIREYLDGKHGALAYYINYCDTYLF